MGEPAPEWEPPSAFEEYQLIRPLGQGAMGQVHLAQDTLLERLVAVKFLSGLAPDEGQRERFRNEARAVARLQHPNIVAVHRTGEVRRRPYLVSEFIRGSSLDKLPWPAPWEKVLGIGIGLARGLAAAHRKGVLHRDLKPANAMLTEDGEVKLLDFGLAKLMDGAGGAREVVPSPPGMLPPVVRTRESVGAATPALRAVEASPGAEVDGSATFSTPGRPARESPREAGEGQVPAALTAVGVWVGTPRYMAPEIWRGESASPRSDVYSLGGVLYVLGTGHPPHHGLDLDALREAVLSRRAPPVASVAPGLEPRLAAIIDRCLEPDPAHRFASAEALREALEALRESGHGEPVLAERPYPGLHAFSAGERGIFFGRGAEVRALLERLRAEPFVLVAGDSGVGKSSVCRAGLLPRIAEGALGGGWTVVTLVPGRHPLAALASALAPLPGLDEARVLEAVRSGPQALGRLLRAHQGGNSLLLFVDQLEELLTLAEPEQAVLLAESLGKLAEGVPGVRLLATVRGDFLTRLAALPGLGDMLSGAMYLLRPLSEAGLHEAITAPARARGVAFESEALVEALVAAGRAEGALPLLQFALAELWEAREAERHLIPAAALEALGGVAGALARHADGVLARLLPAQQLAARRLLLRLVTAEGTRARRTAEELLGSGGEAQEARVALEALVRGRLLVAREAGGEEAGAGTYELAHEALLVGWDTLRGWLAGDVEQRALRQRLERACAEWQRLGRTGELLWSGRQLAEAGRLAEAELSEAEVLFLRASRRAVRRQRLGRVAAVLSLPLALAVGYGGLELRARFALEREVARALSVAGQSRTGALREDERVEVLRREAFTAFDERRKEAAEAAWAEALRLASRVEDSLVEATQTLMTVLERDSRHPEVRRELAGLLSERIRLAERDRRTSLRGELLRHLESVDDTGEFRRHLEEPAHLRLESSPPGAEVLLEQAVEEEGRMHWSPPRALGATPLEDVALAPGSYRLTLRRKDAPPVHYPVLLERGERHRAHVPLPAPVPEGYVYVPPGRFLYGSGDDELIRRTVVPAPPLHPLETGGYLIGRTEVTYAEWLTFLRSLPPAERAIRRPHGTNYYGSIELVEQPPGQWEFRLKREGHVYRAREGEPVHYLDRTHRAEQDWLRFPVSSISWEDARAYLAWLDSTGRVRGARLCGEYEWERAARGADGRSYPHGNRLEPEDANFDATYGRKSLAFGPDEVGSHPASDSPFGVADLSGNVWEWLHLSTSPEVAVYGGGGFYQDMLTARSLNHGDGDPMMRYPFIGLRVCATAPVP